MAGDQQAAPLPREALPWSVEKNTGRVAVDRPRMASLRVCVAGMGGCPVMGGLQPHPPVQAGLVAPLRVPRRCRVGKPTVQASTLPVLLQPASQPRPLTQQGLMGRRRRVPNGGGIERDCGRDFARALALPVHVQRHSRLHRFQDDFTGTANDVLILFNDASGNLVGAEDHIFFREVDTNSVTGATYDLRGELIYHADLVTNVISITGAPDLANLAGAGLIVQDTGRLVLDATGSPIFQAGPHQSSDTNKQIFCDAFGQ